MLWSFFGLFRSLKALTFFTSAVQVIEAAIFISLELEMSGVMTGFWILGCSSLAVLVFLLHGYRKSFSRANVYGALSAFMYILGSLIDFVLTGDLKSDQFQSCFFMFLYVSFAFGAGHIQLPTALRLVASLRVKRTPAHVFPTLLPRRHPLVGIEEK